MVPTTDKPDSEAPPRSPTPLTALALAAQVAPFAELKGLTLVHASFGSKLHVKSVKSEDPVKVKVEYTIESPNLLTSADFSMEVPLSGKKADGPGVHIDAEFALIYELSKPFDDNAAAVERFAQINSLYNAWPYWREFVQSCTVRLGLPPLTLPLLTASNAVAKLGLVETPTPAVRSTVKKLKKGDSDG